MRVNKQHSNEFRCRDCGSLLFKYSVADYIDPVGDLPDAKDLVTGDATATIQIKCKCKTFNTLAFRDVTVRAKPARISSVDEVLSGAHK